MPRNEDGEFELILGNRQLLSVFFIVVILLGVFFTMGYIVGRNSSPMTADSRRPDKPLVVENRPAPAGTPAETPVPEAKPPAAEPLPVAKAVPEKAVEVPAKKDKDKKEKEPPKVEEKPSRRSTAVPDQPAPGEQYLQIAAVAKAEAQLFIDVLAKKGFHALYAPVPDKPETFRVLVGPYRDSAAIAQAREDLEKAGFQGRKSLPRKY